MSISNLVVIGLFCILIMCYSALLEIVVFVFEFFFSDKMFMYRFLIRTRKEMIITNQ